MFKSIIVKLLVSILDKPLPTLSKFEKENLSELQFKFQKLSTKESTNTQKSEIAWIKNMTRLKELVLKKNPREFLRWDVITETMFLAYVGYVSKELKYLKSLPDWKTRWQSAIKESYVGHPTPYILYPSSSANLIHHAYHIAQFEKTSGKQITDMDLIFEFGGGYGSMCRLFHNLGFTGKYVIFDLPSFSALQQYYLKTLGLTIKSINQFDKSENGIFCISNINYLKDIFANNTSSTNKMFVATWSISEAPLSIRNNILPLLLNFQAFLIAYQNKFGEMNNIDFFNYWKINFKNINFNNWEINHLPGNNYLIGTNN